MNITLNTSNVNGIFEYCLFSKGEVRDQFAIGLCILYNSHYGFHPGRIQEKRNKILALLSKLPEGFLRKEKDGIKVGGLCYLDAGRDCYGNQWTDSPLMMERLFALGVAVGGASFKQNRNDWPDLPRRAPHVVIYKEPGEILIRSLK